MQKLHGAILYNTEGGRSENVPRPFQIFSSAAILDFCGGTVFLHGLATKQVYQNISSLSPKTHTTIGYTVFLQCLTTKQTPQHTPYRFPKSRTPIGYTVFLHGSAPQTCFPRPSQTCSKATLPAFSVVPSILTAFLRHF